MYLEGGLKGRLEVKLFIEGHEFEFFIKRFHKSMWVSQLRNMFLMIVKIMNKSINRSAVYGAEEILRKGK